MADILGGSKVLLFGNVIDQEFNVANNWNLGSGLSIVLMIFIFISMAIMNRHASEEGDNMLLGFSCMRRYLCYLSAHLTILNQEPFGAASPCTGILIYFRMRKYFQP